LAFIKTLNNQKILKALVHFPNFTKTPVCRMPGLHQCFPSLGLELEGEA